MNVEKEKSGNRPFEAVKEEAKKYNYQPMLKVVKNFYFITGVAFLLWVAFFDSNNLVQQYRLKQKLKNLQAEKEYYEKEIAEMEKRMKELNSDPVQLEKFAREKYLFKRKGEDVYLVKELK